MTLFRSSCFCLGLVVAVLAGPAASHAQDTADRSVLHSAAWLAGCWQAISQDGMNAADEQWMSPMGGLMVGMSRSVRGGQARGYELLTLRAEDGLLIYHAAPSGQEPTDFSATIVEADRLEFVNREHDFPKKIVYAMIEDDVLHASVFAEADGAEPAFLVPYRRMRCPAP